MAVMKLPVVVVMTEERALLIAEKSIVFGSNNREVWKIGLMPAQITLTQLTVYIAE